jgi:polysaccharide pyruvyl transferase WcaK-like protein
MHILLRSSWQTVNIGDIGHTPGMLALLREHLPEARVTLWASRLDRGVREMLARDFPEVALHESHLDAEGLPAEPALRAAWESADLLLHGSGPSLVARHDVERWAERAGGRPFGVLGVTLENLHRDPALVALLSRAAFVFCRDTVSLEHARAAGVACPVLDFAPDATFAAADRDEETAEAFLRRHDLGPGRFICVVPRLRYTPYHKIHGRPATAEDLRREAVSEAHREADHAKLRAVMEEWIRQTGLRVLACPEMTYQVPLAKELLIDPLPPELRGSVVWRDSYWRPDEAASVYARAVAVVSLEMHSPILAATVGTPAIHLRQPTDTCKGRMWADLGLADWLFEIDETDPEQVAARLLAIHAAPEAARHHTEAALAYARSRHAAACALVRQSVAERV